MSSTLPLSSIHNLFFSDTFRTPSSDPSFQLLTVMLCRQVFEAPVRSTGTHDLRVEHLKVGLLRTCFLDRHDVDSLRLSRNPSRSPAEFWPNTDRIAVELGLG